MLGFSDRERLHSARTVLEHVAPLVGARFSVRLWDGSCVPLGPHADTGFAIAIAGPGVIGSMLRRPTLENLLRHYATGQIDFQGGDLIAFGELARVKRLRGRLHGLSKLLLLRHTLPFLFARSATPRARHAFHGDETGRHAARRNNRDYVQFHYDVGNDFYQLFLDPEMQYSCAYFTDWANTLEQAQRDKLEMICRKLRLEPGEKLLDVGCGWGGLLCYAAQHYGVRAHGVTLSETQYRYTQQKIRALGLEDRVTVELRDYAAIDGRYDKIASIGMFEHVGIANFPAYFGKLHGLLRDRGMLLNHGIARRAKAGGRKAGRMRPEQRLMARYIFPGGELDNIGHTLQAMEACRFEVHDVEGWREHYAHTTRLWCQRLTARRDEAIARVGPERYRLWVAYLAAVSFAFTDGALRIYQVVATKHAAKGVSGLPPTRADLYATKERDRALHAAA
jgi:cyclopropane-fatty-acyl-phospholipid synthase